MVLLNLWIFAAYILVCLVFVSIPAAMYDAQKDNSIREYSVHKPLICP